MQEKQIRTYCQGINERLLHVVTELVADHAPEHAHVLEGQVVDVQVAVGKDLEERNVILEKYLMLYNCQIVF